MKRGGIVLRLFIITLVSFSIFLGVFMAGQTLFFKDFYIKSKISDLEKNINSFDQEYAKDSSSYKDVIKDINKFVGKNNARIAILDSDGNMKYSPSFNIVMKTNENETVNIPLNITYYLNGLQNMKFNVGDEIVVNGIISDDNKTIITISSIEYKGEIWGNTEMGNVQTGSASISNSSPITKSDNLNDSKTEHAIQGSKGLYLPSANGQPNTNLSSGGFKEKSLKGKILELNTPSQVDQIASYNNGQFWYSIDYWRQLYKTNKITMESGKILNITYKDFISGMDNIILVKPIGDKIGNGEFIFVVSSLQPVGEAIGAMQKYYFYAFLVALLLIGIMALIFSRVVSRPLIKINNIATKMAGLDFSEKCDIKTNNELGSLASSLNRLSQKLVTSMGELQAANEKLLKDIEKEKMLEAMQKEFVASVSHELKTPLGIIRGFSEGLKDNVTENKRDHYIDVIIDEIEKMNSLVHDLLDLTKFETGNYRVEMETISINGLFSKVVSRLKSQSDKKQHQIEISCTSDDLEVLGDYMRIEQVITNFLSNAIRHTPKSGIIKLAASKEKEQVLITVENSGEHISEEDRKRIWDRFYRVEKSRNRKSGGTGLGLSIVKNILDLHNSRYGVENTDVGVRFSFTLQSPQHP